MKLFKSIIIAAAFTATTNAATVQISGGFGAGVVVATSGVGDVAYTLEVGGFEGGIFTAWDSGAINLGAGAKIAGSFVGGGPASLAGDNIFLRVTTGAGFAVLDTGSIANSNFPTDLSATGSASFTYSAPTPIVQSDAGGGTVGFVGNALTFTPIPEPSIALLGGLGVIGLLRRRR